MTNYSDNYIVKMLTEKSLQHWKLVFNKDLNMDLENELNILAKAKDKLSELYDKYKTLEDKEKPNNIAFSYHYGKLLRSIGYLADTISDISQCLEMVYWDSKDKTPKVK